MDLEPEDEEVLYNPDDPRASLPKVKHLRLHGDIEWPFQISVNSHSKLAQVFLANSSKGDSPNPSYIPLPVGTISKPISNLGYGIGGLLSPRFKPFLGLSEIRPDPGDHQKIEISANEEKKRIWRALGCRVGFGMSLTNERLGQSYTHDILVPGPGSYPISSCKPCIKIKMKEAFGTRRCAIPTTVTVCTIEKGEICRSCGEEQTHDYYRSRFRLKKGGVKDFVALCRKCYCKGMSGKSENWTKWELCWLFVKARHCSYVHNHLSLPNFITKARTKDVKMLTRKETVLGKYFSDACLSEIKI